MGCGEGGKRTCLPLKSQYSARTAFCFFWVFYLVSTCIYFAFVVAMSRVGYGCSGEDTQSFPQTKTCLHTLWGKQRRLACLPHAVVVSVFV